MHYHVSIILHSVHWVIPKRNCSLLWTDLFHRESRKKDVPPATLNLYLSSKSIIRNKRRMQYFFLRFYHLLFLLSVLNVKQFSRWELSWSMTVWQRTLVKATRWQPITAYFLTLSPCLPRSCAFRAIISGESEKRRRGENSLIYINHQPHTLFHKSF